MVLYFFIICVFGNVQVQAMQEGEEVSFELEHKGGESVERSNMVIHRIGLIALILVALAEEQLLNCGSFPQAEAKSLHSYQDFWNAFRACAPESIKSNIATKNLAKPRRLKNTQKHKTVTKAQRTC